MEGLSNLLQNKLFLQYLSGAGADIASGQPIGQNVNAITQQNIAAQNMMGLLAKMLKGEVPEGGKITIDNKGTKIQVPNNQSVQQPSTGGLQSDVSIGQSKLEDFAKLSTFLRPSSGQLENISPGDLAGLSTSDISQALQGALSVKDFGRKRVNDVIDSLYKQKLIDYYNTLIGDKTPSITIPGTDIKLTRKEFLNWYKTASKDERTAAIKNYEYALKHGFEGSFEQFLDRAKTTHQKDYEYYVEQERKMGREPKPFNNWMLDVAKAGGLSIGEIVSRKKALADVAGQLYFKDPKWINDLDRHMKSESVQNKIFTAEDEQLETASEIVRFIENKIKAGGGRIEDVELSEDGRTMTWTVKWPSGDKEVIKHDIRP